MSQSARWVCSQNGAGFKIVSVSQLSERITTLLPNGVKLNPFISPQDFFRNEKIDGKAALLLRL
jgi:hypothetical protein